MKRDNRLDDIKVASVNNGLVLLAGKAHGLDEKRVAIEGAYLRRWRASRGQRNRDGRQLLARRYLKELAWPTCDSHRASGQLRGGLGRASSGGGGPGGRLAARADRAIRGE